MTWKKLRIAWTIGFAVLVAAPLVSAEDDAQAKAEKVRDSALSKLVAWRTKSADNILKRAAEFEKTQPYLTAEAYLMATYSLGREEEIVKRALKILEKQAKDDPSDPVSEFYHGEVLKWMDRPDEAKAAWENASDRAAAAIEVDSKNATARFYSGASLVRLRKPDQARKALKKALKDGFDKPMVDFQIGLTYLLQEKWSSAKNSFDDVHELDPRYAHLYFYRGLASEKLGRKDSLLADLDQFVKLAPNSPEAKTAKAILSAMK